MSFEPDSAVAEQTSLKGKRKKKENHILTIALAKYQFPLLRTLGNNVNQELMRRTYSKSYWVWRFTEGNQSSPRGDKEVPHCLR